MLGPLFAELETGEIADPQALAVWSWRAQQAASTVVEAALDELLEARGNIRPKLGGSRPESGALA